MALKCHHSLRSGRKPACRITLRNSSRLSSSCCVIRPEQPVRPRGRYAPPDRNSRKAFPSATGHCSHQPASGLRPRHNCGAPAVCRIRHVNVLRSPFDQVPHFTLDRHRTCGIVYQQPQAGTLAPQTLRSPVQHPRRFRQQVGAPAGRYTELCP